jgi:tripartite-type tricarboxylate transporter receptor subunit TctC
VKEKLHAAALESTFLDAEAFAAKVRSEIAAYAAVGKRVNITME